MACSVLARLRPLGVPEVLVTGMILKPVGIFAFGMLAVEVFTSQKPFERSA